MFTSHHASQTCRAEAEFQFNLFVAELPHEIRKLLFVEEARFCEVIGSCITPGATVNQQQLDAIRSMCEPYMDKVGSGSLVPHKNCGNCSVAVHVMQSGGFGEPDAWQLGVQVVQSAIVHNSLSRSGVKAEAVKSSSQSSHKSAISG